MARRRLPTSFTAGRRLTLRGTTYAQGATIPLAVVGGLRRASALLSRRWIVPNQAIVASRVPNRKPRPETLQATERRRLIG